MMLPFCLYLVTALVTGLQVYTLLALAAYGLPVNPLEFISLLGSFCLLISAYVSLFKPHVAARIALIASIAMWSFYGPAIAKTVRTRSGSRSVASVLVVQPPAVQISRAISSAELLASRSQ